MACHSAEWGIVGIGFASVLETVAHHASSTEVGFKKKLTNQKFVLCSARLSHLHMINVFVKQTLFIIISVHESNIVTEAQYHTFCSFDTQRPYKLFFLVFILLPFYLLFDAWSGF